MTEERKRESPESDEIDLYSFFSWIGRGFRAFGNSILWGLASLRKTAVDNKKFFAVLIVGGVSAASLYSEFFQKKYYRSSMILSCDYFNSRIISNAIEELNLLCQEGEREGLSAELQIDPEIAKDILAFTAKPFIAENDLVESEVLKEQLNNVVQAKQELVAKILHKLEIENKHAFQIEVAVLKPSAVKPLETALVAYFGNNEYIKKRIEITKKNLVDTKGELLKELNKLDSLKFILYDNLQSMAKQNRAAGSNNVILSDKFLEDPLKIYTEHSRFHRELMDVNMKLHVNPDFEVIDGFTTFNKPDNAGLKATVLVAFIASWVLGYLILGILKFNTYLAKISSNPA